MTLFACVGIPNTAIAIARRDEPALRDHPLVLYTTEPGRAIVAAATDESGAAPGMTLRQALIGCPDLLCRPIDSARVHAVIQALVALLDRFSPRVSATITPPDSMVALDLGQARVTQALALTQQIAAQVRAELGLWPAIGMARTRFVATRAAHTASVGGIPTHGGAAVVVAPGREAAFLAPQPITALPIDAEITRRLQLLGLRTLGAVAAVPLDALHAQFGGLGAQIHRLARGLDDQGIARMRPAPQLMRSCRFTGPLADRVVLEQRIADLGAAVAIDLQAAGWSAQALRVTFRMEDGAPVIADHSLIEATADARKLIQVLLRLCRQGTLQSGVEAVTVAASKLVPAVATQGELFAPFQGHADRLRDVLGRLGARHTSSLLRPTLTNPQARLPEQRVRLDPLEPQ